MTPRETAERILAIPSEIDTGSCYEEGPLTEEAASLGHQLAQDYIHWHDLWSQYRQTEPNDEQRGRLFGALDCLWNGQPHELLRKEGGA